MKNEIKMLLTTNEDNSNVAYNPMNMLQVTAYISYQKLNIQRIKTSANT